MELIIVVLAIVVLAFWRQTRTLKIVAGILMMVFGAYWISLFPTVWIYIASGVAYAVVGLYLLLTSGSND
jgi:intracellular septation protein A